MLEVDQLTYTAIISINLPGTDRPATATITLTPRDAVPTSSGEVKLLRDCTLADLNEFAEALEAEVWAAHQERLLTDLAGDDAAHIKITIMNETGRPLSMNAEDWLAHAVILPDPAPAPAEPRPAEEPAERTADLTTDLPEETDSPLPPAEEKPATTTGEEDAGPPLLTADATPATAEGESATGEKRPVIAVEAEAAVAEPEVEPATEPPREEAAREPEADEPETGTAEPQPATPVPALPPLVAAPPEPVAEPEIRIAGLRRPQGHPTPAAVDILVNEPVYRDAQAHALSSLDREVAGVLVGPMPEKQPDGRYVVHITDMIIAKHTKMHGASVTYTPESWRYIHDRLAERYPHEEALIVGWYHTHPGFGIFLSGMDLFIHQNFFTQIWHVALVLDPVARRSGFFCWNRGQTEVQRYEFPWPKWLAGSW